MCSAPSLSLCYRQFSLVTVCTGESGAPKVLQDRPSFTTSPWLPRLTSPTTPVFCGVTCFISLIKGKYHPQRTWAAQPCMLSFQPHCLFTHLAVEIHTHALAPQAPHGISTLILMLLPRAILPSSCPHLLGVAARDRNCSFSRIPVYTSIQLPIESYL